MREIKFRGKLAGMNGFVYGVPHNVYSDDLKNDRWFDSIQYLDESGHPKVEYIESDTLSQYTGLVDKNGKEIYEGDIIGIDNIEQKYYVKWEDGAFYLFHTEFKDWNNHPLKWGLLSRAFEADMIKFGKISVIGNIHENK